MADLVTQPNAFPVRKVLAVMISGMIIGAVQSLLALFWPDHPFAALMDQADIWIQFVVMSLAGYFTKERAK